MSATLTNDTFVGTTGASLSITGTNIPSGLSLLASKLTDTTAKIYLSGKATSNNSINSISNLGFTFGNSAFTSGLASSVSNSTKSGVSLNFTDNITATGSLAFSSTSITENTANNGALAPLTVTLTGDTFASTISVTGTNLPAGITGVNASKIDDTHATITFTGNATLHQASNSTTNFSLAFAGSSFTNGDATKITNSTKILPITFTNNTRSLAFDKTSLNEVSANNGAVDGFITVTLTGDTFVGAVNSTLPVTVANVPTGLTAVATKLTDTTAKIAFTGNATNHALSNSVTSVKVVFGDSAFSQQSASLVTNNSTTQNFGIVFKDASLLSYSATSFAETASNAGAVSTITATLTSDTFTGLAGDELPITVTNLPAGFTSASAVKYNDTTAILNLYGAATLHQAGHSITNLGIAFNNTAFTNGSATAIANSTKIFPINYTDNSRYLAFDKTSLSETANNDGSINGSITISLFETGGTSPKGDGFVLDSTNHVPVTVTNLPAGLTAVVTRPTYSNQVVLSFTGNATNHQATNSVSNLKIIFPDSAFIQGYSSLVTNNSTTQNFSLSFRDTPSLSYSSGTFIEADANNGSIGNKVTVTLSGDTFTGTAGSILAITSTNVPSNLSVVVKKVDDTHAEIALEGSAINHANANDISNMSITFADTDFTNTSTASSILNSTKQFYVDFNDSVSGADPDNNGTETGMGVSHIGLINSYGKTIASLIGAPATSATSADNIDYFKFNLAYKGKVYADNTISSITTYVKDDSGTLQPISSTMGVELSAGDHYFKVATTASTQQSYSIKLRAISSANGADIISAPRGSTNTTSPYTTEGYQAVLNTGSSQNLTPLKWNSAGTTSSSAIIAYSPSGNTVALTPTSSTTTSGSTTQSSPLNMALIAPQILLDDGHVRATLITREELFPRNPNDPVIQSIPMYSDANGYLILNYSFNYQNNSSSGTSQNPTGVTLSAFNTTQKTAVRQAFDEWEKYAKIKFVDVTGTTQDTYNSVNMFIGNVSSDSGAAYVRAWYDSTNSLLKTDFWVNAGATSSHTVDPAKGNYGYTTFLHEIGHALGLKHPGNYNAGGGGANGPFLTTALDTHQYSIMSYNNSVQTVDISSSGYYYTINGVNTSIVPFESTGIDSNSKPITPSIFDIPAAQLLYTTNTTATSGNNTYSWNVNQNVNVYASLSDAGGTDTLDLSNQSKKQTINLTAGTFSSLGAFENNLNGSKFFTPNNNFSINYQTVIENAIGGSIGDVIVGNSVDNVIDGKGGNDTLTGGDGNNTFVFSTTPNASTNTDTITDFKAGDRINLSLATFSTLGGTAGSELDSNNFSNSTIETSTTRIYLDSSVSNQVNLYYDSDGNGSTAGVKFATLTNISSSFITSANFGIIA